MKNQSSNLFDDEGVFRHADIVDEMFELYRRSNHFSLRKRKPELPRALAQKLEHIPRRFVEEALKIYKDAGKRLGKIPHPNYLYAVAKRLSEENLDKKKYSSYNKEPRINKLGRSI